MMQTEAQSDASNGAANARIFAVADTRKAAQNSADVRGLIGGNDAHAAVDLAAAGGAGGRGGAAAAAREAAGAATVTKYGSGMSMDASNRAALATADAQRAIMANLDNAPAAARVGAATAYAASCTHASHQWTGANAATGGRRLLL